MQNEFDTELHDRVANAYDAFYELLRFIAGHRFRIPASDIRPLVHDVFVSFIRHEQVVADDRRWLTAAMGNACRNYWRNLRPALALPEELLDPRNEEGRSAARHDIEILLARLSDKCQSILRLRYVEGLDPGEIAARCGTSPGYVRLKVHRCLEAAKCALAELA